jgi:predicted nucleotidyltransferase
MKAKSIKQRIQEHFFQNPLEKMRLRQIERALSVPLPSVIRYVKELKEEKILQTVEVAGVTFYTADRSSKRFLMEKTFFNTRSLADSGLTKYLVKQYGNPTIILFGSYSRGEDTGSSDIDIYVESASKQKMALEKFEKILGRKIQLFVHSSIKNISNPHLANNIINGISLNGFIEVFA